jgi:hypothetical protein
MEVKWGEKLKKATECGRCKRALGSGEQRILSVYDDEVLCSECKKAEEHRSNYEEVSRKMVGQCLADVELFQGDPGGYCFHHFYPYTRK